MGHGTRSIKSIRDHFGEISHWRLLGAPSARFVINWTAQSPHGLRARRTGVRSADVMLRG